MSFEYSLAPPLLGAALAQTWIGPFFSMGIPLSHHSKDTRLTDTRYETARIGRKKCPTGGKRGDLMTRGPFVSKLNKWEIFSLY